MASLRVPALRHTISGAAPYLRASQRRWAQVHDVRFLMTQQSDRILEKYKEKLAKKAQEEGLRDINELKEVYQNKIQLQKKKASIAAIPNAPKPTLEAPTSKPASAFPAPPPPPKLPTETSDGTPSAGIKTLSSYLNLEKSSQLPPKELEAIWRLRHASDAQSLCAVVPLSLFKTIQANAKKFPHFILPLPKDPSLHPDAQTEIHFLQWTFPAPDTCTVIFTHLAEFKLRGEYSQPHTTITHHLELAEDKGLVLMQGNVMEGRGVSVEEAKWLVMCLQKFYGVGGEEVGGTAVGMKESMEKRKRLLEMFGRGDAGFTLEELVDEAEKIV